MKNSAPPPRISVIIPLYNSKRFIETCINSILLQTFTDFELVVVDDRSTDGSFELVREKYCDESSENYDPRVKLFRNFRNAGSGGRNNNNALNVIQPSEYVYMMGDDDGLVANALETLVNAADESKADIVAMDGYYTAAENDFEIPGVIKSYKTAPPERRPRMLSEDLVERIEQEVFNFYGVLATEWAKFFRRDFLVKNGIYHPNVFGIEDFFHNFACLCLAKRFRVISAELYIYRQNSQSVMHVSAQNHVRKTVLSFVEGILYMEEIFSKDLISPLSRENQILLESYALFYLIQQRITRYQLSPLEIDEILREILCESSMLDPNITRLLILAMNQLLSFGAFNKGDMKTPFDLKR